MYFHGVINGLVNKKVLEILRDQEIKSARKRNDVNNVGFNENDFISICEYLGEDIYADYPNNAFHKYILNNFCFIISNDIDCEMPIFIPNAATMNRFELIKLRRENPKRRFSDIIDERQVRDSIPFDKVIGIGIPYGLEEENGFIKLSSFTFLTPDEFQEFIRTIENYAAMLGIKVVNSSDPTFSLTFKTNELKKTK